MVKSVGLLLVTTTPDIELARKLAQSLVQQKLAACVNIVGPVTSFYFWNEQIVQDQEYKLFIKTALHLKEQAVAFIKENHSYQVPEISAIPITYENPDYANWLFNYVKDSSHS